MLVVENSEAAGTVRKVPMDYLGSKVSECYNFFRTNNT